jgi:uncharacterized protein DUF992
MFHSRSALAAVALILAFVASSSAQAQQGQKVGTLTCKLSPSIGLIIGSQQRMACLFQPSGGGPPEAYSGVQNRIGLDIGISAGGALAWGVFAQTAAPISRGALAGHYGGASGDIGIGLGVGANVLFGGSNNTISLQPLSVEGSISLNLALGVAGLTLTWVR